MRDRSAAMFGPGMCAQPRAAAYAWLADPAPVALATLAPERTFHIASLSKSLASGLRFGYVVVPQACAVRVKAVIRASHWSLPSLVTAMATRWIADGTVAQQEIALRHDAHRRQAIAADALAGLDVRAHPASPFLWLRLPEDLRMDGATEALAERGIAVSKAEAYATGRHAPHALRLALGSVPVDALEPVLRRLRDTLLL
ncbi:aminotransferase class I/II-fold pyridoxal phosphate-dependent enzyme [Luteimonas sp. TWI662]|uniref:aminotransferase class I/II-fold pyridoxal phosphate-dependent enzyme n=1 Tax=Luteimonas sp. TWI662 TaxID=3136789 RepID=UPI003209BB32